MVGVEKVHSHSKNTSDRFIKAKLQGVPVIRYSQGPSIRYNGRFRKKIRYNGQKCLYLIIGTPCNIIAKNSSQSLLVKYPFEAF